MAVASTIGHFIKTNAVGNQDVTADGNGTSLPDLSAAAAGTWAIRFWTNGVTSSPGSWQSHFMVSIGFTTGPANSYCLFSDAFDGQTTLYANRRMAAKCITAMYTNSAVTYWEADFVQMLAGGGFRLNWTSNDGSAPWSAVPINFEIITGLTGAKALSWTAPTVTGLKAVTGVGFKPDLVFHASDFHGAAAIPSMSAYALFSVGVMNKHGQQWFNQFTTKGGAGAAPSDNGRWQQVDACLGYADTAQTTWTQAHFQSMDADGFTTHFSQVDGVANPIISLALGGVSSKIGAFGKRTTAGTQTVVTRHGFTPRSLTISTFGSPSSAPLTQALWEMGVTNGSSARHIALVDVDAQATTNADSVWSNTLVLGRGAAAAGTQSYQYAATLSAWSTESFTLNLSQSDGSVTEVLYLLIGDAGTDTFPSKILSSSNTTFDGTGLGSQKKLAILSTGRKVAVFGVTSGGAAYAKIMWSDDGVAWTDYGQDIAGWANGSIAVYVDSPGNKERLVVTWRQSGTGGSRTDLQVYAMVGTFSTDRSSIVWGAASIFANNVYGGGFLGRLDYPDIVAHPEGTGGRAHVIVGYVNSGVDAQIPIYTLPIDADGLIGTWVNPTGAGGSASGTLPHPFPSIDYNPATKDLYTAWSWGTTGAGKGIRYKKYTYSAGVWTAGSEREIDTTVYNYNPSFTWLACRFDGTRVMIIGHLYDGSWRMVAHERDLADTTTHLRKWDNESVNEGAFTAGGAIDPATGDVYLLGRGYSDVYGFAYNKWSRSTNTLTRVPIEHGHAYTVASPTYNATAKRIEWIYTHGNGTPYQVRYDYLQLRNPQVGLTSPSANTSANFNAGYTFKWSYYAPDAAVQTGWAFKRIRSGDSVAEYWNNTTTTWQLQEVYNSGATTQLTFASGKWPVGQVYQWTVSVQNANGVSGYAPAFTITDSNSSTGVQVKVGSFVKQSTPGFQDVTIGTDLTSATAGTWAIMFWTTGSDVASGVWKAHAVTTLGFTTGSSNSYSVSTAALDGVATSDTARTMTAKAISLLDNGGSAVNCQADFDSFPSPTTMRLNWTSNLVGGTYGSAVINYIVISGLSAAKVGVYLSSSGAGSKSLAGVGFKPDLVIIGHAMRNAISNSTNSMLGFGAFNAHGQQWANNFWQSDNANPSNTSRWQQTDACILAVNASETADVQAHFVSMDPDGFTLFFSTNNFGIYQYPVLCLKGVSSKLGAFTKSTATAPTNQVVASRHGFNIKAALFSSDRSVSPSAPETHALWTLGATDTTNSRVAVLEDVDAVTPTITKSMWESGQVIVRGNGTAAPATLYKASWQSSTANDFTLNWSVNETNASEHLYLLLGDPGTSTTSQHITTTNDADATALPNQKRLVVLSNGNLIAMWDESNAGRFHYSSNKGQTWTYMSGQDIAGVANGSIATYVDSSGAERLVVVWKQSGTGGSRTDGYIYSIVGTLNSARTAITWGTAYNLSGTTGLQAGYNYPDVVAFADGAGGQAGFTVSFERSDAAQNYLAYQRLPIDGSGNFGTFSYDNLVDFSGTDNWGVLGGAGNVDIHPYPSMDYNPVTKDIFVAWSEGTTGAGKGIRFRRAAYANGTWTWGSEVEVDPNGAIINTGRWVVCRWSPATSEVYIGGYFEYPSGVTVSARLYRSSNLTSFATNILIPAEAYGNHAGLFGGTMAVDGATGDAYFIGDSYGGVVNQQTSYYKFTHTTLSFGSAVALMPEPNSGLWLWASSQYNPSANRIEWIYTSGNNAPYAVKYDYIQLNKPPVVVLTAPAAGTGIEIEPTVLSRAQAYWRVGEYGGSGALFDSSGNGHTMALPGGVNNPKYLSFDGEKYLYLPGAASNSVFIADHDQADISGDLDIRAKVALDDWTPAADITPIGKWTAAGDQRSYKLVVYSSSPAGRLMLQWSELGTAATIKSALSTIVPTVADGEDLWIRATLDVNNGAGGHTVRFYTSADGATWSQLGADVVTAGVTSVYAGTSPLYLGANLGGADMAGKLYRVVLKNGIDGGSVLDVDFNNSEEPHNSFVCTTGQTITINRGTTGAKSVLVDRPLMLFGTNDYLSTPDHPSLNFAANDSFTVVIALRGHGNSSTHQSIVSKRNLASSKGWELNHNGGTNTSRFTVHDGTIDGGATGTSDPYTGEARVLVGRRSVVADQTSIFLSGTHDITVTDSTTGSSSNVSPMRIGARYEDASIAGYADMEFIGAAIFREALTDADIAALNYEFGVGEPDAARSTVFSWSVTDTEGDTQQSFVLRRRRPEHTTYEYWDVAGARWSGALVENYSSETSATIPDWAWGEGAEFSWSVGVRDSSGLSPIGYSSERTITNSAFTPTVATHVGSFTKGSLGNQDIAIPVDLTAAPAGSWAIIFWTTLGNNNPGSGAWANNIQGTLGFTTGPSNSYATGWASDDGVATSNSSRRMAAKCISLPHPNGASVWSEADFVGFPSATTMRINWTTDLGNASNINYMIISGVTGAKVIFGNIGTTGDVSFTGSGFSPDLVLLSAAWSSGTLTLPWVGAYTYFGFGAMNRHGQQWGNGFLIRDAETPANSTRWQQTDAVIAVPQVSEAMGVQAHYKSMDSDGFTLNVSYSNFPLGVVALCIAGVSSKVGTLFTNNAFTQTVDTRHGFTPRGLFVSSTGAGAVSAPIVHATWGAGAYDGTNQRLSTLISQDGVNPTFDRSLRRTDRTAYFLTAFPSTGGAGSVTAWNQTSMTWSWDTAWLGVEFPYILIGDPGVSTPPSKIIDTTWSAKTGYPNQRQIVRLSDGKLVWSGQGSNFYYSTDNGVTWISYGATIDGVANISIYAYVDGGGVERLVATWKQTGTGGGRTDGDVYVMVGTFNTARTSLSWGTASYVIGGASSGYNYPDVVAIAEGAGGVAIVTWGYSAAGATYGGYWSRVPINGAGAIVSVTSLHLGSASTASSVHPYPSIDINPVTKDLYLAWSAPATGAGKGIRFQKATYYNGTWTWGTEVEVDNTKYIEGDWSHLRCRWDGNRIVISGKFHTQVLALWDSTNGTSFTARATMSTPGGGYNRHYYGASLPDANGDVYFFGSDTYAFMYTKWTRGSNTYGTTQLLDTLNTTPGQYQSPNYYNGRIEWVYAMGNGNPYQVKYDYIIVNAAPVVTLVSPEAGARTNLATSIQFSWSFTDAEGNAQTHYVFRRRRDGFSTYEYWNGTVWTASYTEIASAATNVTFPSGSYVDGRTYYWSVGVKDSAGSVGWSAERKVTNTGGTGVKVKVGSFAGRNTLGTSIVTGLGFKPKAILFWTTTYAGSAGTWNSHPWPIIGLTTGPSNSYSAGIVTQDGVGSTNTLRRINAKAITFLDFNTGLSEADLQSMDSDGFTLNWTSVGTGIGTEILYMAIGGDDVSGAKVVQSAYSGTSLIPVTGVGFKPDLVIVGASYYSPASLPSQGTNSYLGLGYFNAQGQQGGNGVASQHGVGGSTANRTMRIQQTDAAIAIPQIGGAPSIAWEAHYHSMDSDGFTLKPSTSVSNIVILSLCLKGISSKIGSFITTATAVQKVDCVGFTPKAVLVSNIHTTPQAAPVTTIAWSTGFSDGTTNRASAASDVDASATVSAKAVWRSDSALMVAYNGTLTARATASFDVDRIDFTYGVQSANFEQIYLAIGDAGISTFPALVGTSTATTATRQANQRKLDRMSTGRLVAVYCETANAKLKYSDDGVNWVDMQSDIAGWSNGSMFIDLDDHVHVIFKQSGTGGGRSDLMMYYMMGTINSAKNGITWSSHINLDSGNSTEGDVVAHREGTGWVAHCAWGHNGGPNSVRYVYYSRIPISSSGSVGSAASTLLQTYSNPPSTPPNVFPTIDFNHTGDGKTVKDAVPHIYMSWSAGQTGSGWGMRFRKATYNSGSWAWGTEREIDNSHYNDGFGNFSNLVFDGVRVIIAGELGSDVMMYERDAADTTTTTRVIAAGVGGSTRVTYGSITYDQDGNMYIMGTAGGTGSQLNYRKWNRATQTTDSQVFLESWFSGLSMSARRGYFNNKIEFVYTYGNTSPYAIKYDVIATTTEDTDKKINRWGIIPI